MVSLEYQQLGIYQYFLLAFKTQMPYEGMYVKVIASGQSEMAQQW